MNSISIVVVPISLLPVETTQLRVVAHRPAGEWLRCSADGTRSPLETAIELVQSSSGLHPMGRRPLRLEPAGFLESKGALHLVFTAPLPLSAPLMEGASRGDFAPHDWPLLAPWFGRPKPDSAEVAKRLAEVDDVHRLVLNHWRQLIEETTAAFELLPEHFTTAQLRAVYSSIWGTPQDAGNFHRWLHRLNRGVCSEVSAEVVQRDVDQALQQSLEGTPLQNEGLDLHLLRAERLIGISPMVLGALRGLPTLVTASALVAGYVAYQGAAAPGKPPQWYTRAEPDRQVLDVLYSPRPAWLRGRLRTHWGDTP